MRKQSFVLQYISPLLFKISEFCKLHEIPCINELDSSDYLAIKLLNQKCGQILCAHFLLPGHTYDLTLFNSVVKIGGCTIIISIMYNYILATFQHFNVIVCIPQ